MNKHQQINQWKASIRLTLKSINMQCMFCVGISFNKTKRKAKRCDDGSILNASNDPRYNLNLLLVAAMVKLYLELNPSIKHVRTGCCLLLFFFLRFSMPDVLFALWIFVFFFVVVCVCHLWPLFVQTETKNSQESPIYKFAEQWCYKQKQTGTNRQQENEERK